MLLIIFCLFSTGRNYCQLSKLMFHRSSHCYNRHTIVTNIFSQLPFQFNFSQKPILNYFFFILRRTLDCKNNVISVKAYPLELFSFPLTSANWKEVFLYGHSAGMALLDFLKLSAMLFIQCHDATSKLSASLASYKSGVCDNLQSILY